MLSNKANPGSRKLSPQLRRILSLSRWCMYGFWFALGLSWANLSRAIGFRLLYLLASLAISGYLFTYRPKDATTSELSHQRLCGLAVLLSGVAFWDEVILIATAPLAIGKLVIPAWQAILSTVCIVSGILIGVWGERRK
jgi:hypothetical protein